MAVRYKTRRQKERKDATGLTGGELADLRDKVENRFARANNVAGYSAGRTDTQGQMATVDQRARLEAAAGQTPANDRAERIKDPQTADVRAYRKEHFNIDDLRTATAEQIEQARKDPKAFRHGQIPSLDEGTKELAAAQAAAQGGKTAGGKPASFIGYPGGRRPPSDSRLPLLAQLTRNQKKAKKKTTSIATVSGGSG